MTDIPSYDLELKAAEERRNLHDSLKELRFRVKDKLDLKHNARLYLGPACAVAGIVAFTTGYLFTGIFVHK